MTVSLTVAVGAPEPLTTGASQVTINPVAQCIAITTGGTGGVELVKIDYPELTEDDFTNNSLAARRVVVFLETQTDPGDVVKFVNSGDGNEFNTYKPVPVPHGFSEITLTYVGAGVTFLWVGDDWVVDEDLTDGNFDYVSENTAVDLFAPPASVEAAHGNSFRMSGGRFAGPSNGRKAGNAVIRGGVTDDNAESESGDVIICPGTSDGAPLGNVRLVFEDGTTLAVPIADPLELGALFVGGPLVPGTPMALMISAGPS